ncbi:hypothetical protein HON52_04145 [Candidatus Uhrbacteria bacterium]|jgi:cell division septal protein FtsQ|nr:hypothetical protein [Candidatus Uhrbacteria bacterium]
MKRRNFLKKHHARRYTSDRFRNPYFSGKKIVPWTKRVLRLLVVLAVIIGIPWLTVILPWFYIDSVAVEGSITLQPNQIESFAWDHLNEKRWDVVPQHHIWLLNEDALRNDILSQFALDDATVTRDGRSLSIVVNERITSLIWAHGEELYFVDQSGFIVRALNEEEINDVRALLYGEGERINIIQTDEIFVVFEQGGEVVSQNQQVLTENAVEVLSVVNQDIGNYLITIESISIDTALTDWVALNTRGGPDIYVDLNGDGNDQLHNLEVILDEYKSNLEGIEYIDLRFGNRVFVK